MFQPWRLGEWGVPLHAIAPWSTITQIGSTWLVAPIGQIEQTVYEQMTDIKLWLLCSNIWNH